MTSTRLDGKRVLLTQRDDFMGPAQRAVFPDSGAEVLADDPGLPTALVCEAGHVDVLIHLPLPAPSTPAVDIGAAEWRCVFTHLVDPMLRPTSAVMRPPTSWGRCFPQRQLRRALKLRSR